MDGENRQSSTLHRNSSTYLRSRPTAEDPCSCCPSRKTARPLCGKCSSDCHPCCRAYSSFQGRRHRDFPEKHKTLRFRRVVACTGFRTFVGSLEASDLRRCC